jgi:hypothetical protein
MGFAGISSAKLPRIDPMILAGIPSDRTPAPVCMGVGGVLVPCLRSQMTNPKVNNRRVSSRSMTNAPRLRSPTIISPCLDAPMQACVWHELLAICWPTLTRKAHPRSHARFSTDKADHRRRRDGVAPGTEPHFAPPSLFHCKSLMAAKTSKSLERRAFEPYDPCTLYQGVRGLSESSS